MKGAKGPITCDFAKVTLHRDGLPCKTVWLIIKKTLSPDPIYSYYAYMSRRKGKGVP